MQANGDRDKQPGNTLDAAVWRKHLITCRGCYAEDMLERERDSSGELERQVRKAWRDKRVVGEKIANIVANCGGSWRFILVSRGG